MKNTKLVDKMEISFWYVVIPAMRESKLFRRLGFLINKVFLSKGTGKLIVQFIPWATAGLVIGFIAGLLQSFIL